MSQLLVSFREEGEVSTGMIFELVKPDNDQSVGDDLFTAAMTALAKSIFFENQKIERVVENPRVVSQGFAEEVDAGDIMFLVLQILGRYGFYFHGKGLDYYVFNQRFEPSSQVVFTSAADEDGNNNFAFKLVNVVTPQGMPDDEQWFDAMGGSVIFSDHPDPGKWKEVRKVPGEYYSFMYQGGGDFGPSMFKTILGFLHSYGWVFHGEAEDNYVFFRG